MSDTPLTDYQRGLADGIHAAGQYPTLTTDIHFLHDYIERYPQPPDGQVNEPELRARLKAMMPLFQEARDALPAITKTAMMLRGLSPSLADRMDDVGIAERWKKRAALADTGSKA